jgi:hypothetical protein
MIDVEAVERDAAKEEQHAKKVASKVAKRYKASKERLSHALHVRLCNFFLH